MNGVNRHRPNISPDEIERLLFHFEYARNYVIKYGSAQDFHSPNQLAAETVTDAIDELARHIAGKE